MKNDDIYWSEEDTPRARYILEPPYDTLEDLHKLLFVDHLNDEIDELYDDFGLMVIIFKKNMKE